MTVAAVVVSYNRRTDLRRCLSALQRQTGQLDEIIVVDNGSSDGTLDMLQNEFSHVVLDRPLSNLGGAGGFARGVDIAIRHGHRLAWLMDDDAEPEDDALAPLLEAMHIREPILPGFVAATVVDRDQGRVIEGHLAPEVPQEGNHGFSTTSSLHSAAFSTFVGVLINLEVSAETWLPVQDFFIWWDDIEYTARLQERAGGLRCSGAVVKHPKQLDTGDLRERLVYDVRNRIWVLRDQRLGSTWSRRRAAETLWKPFRPQYWARRNEYWASSNRIRYFRYIVRGTLSGMLTKPKLQMPSS